MKVTEKETLVQIESTMPVGQRIPLVLLALVPLLAPHELILRIDWQGYLNPVFLFAALISAGALAVTALLVWAAVAGLSSRLELDRVRRLVTYASGAPVMPRRTSRDPIDAIDRLQVETHQWSDGPPSYSLVVRMKDGRLFKAGSSWSREDIEDVERRASAFLERA